MALILFGRDGSAVRRANSGRPPRTAGGRAPIGGGTGHQVLAWCIGNVVGKADRRGNLYPTKTRPDQKIDAAIALMMAIGRVMTDDENARNPGSFLTDLIAI